MLSIGRNYAVASGNISYFCVCLYVLYLKEIYTIYWKDYLSPCFSIIRYAISR